MFMGSAAFGYYFPVVDRHLRTVAGAEEWGDCSAAILGSGVAAQFEWNGAQLSFLLVAEIGDPGLLTSCGDRPAAAPAK
jgi:hypothetical protein